MLALPAMPVALSLGTELDKVGTVVSNVIDSPEEAEDVFPATSVAFAVILKVPALRVPVVHE